MANVDLASTLTKARARLDEGADEAALEALLTAWRAKREPRIAEAIDRVSERLTAAREPIAAKSVKARTAAWASIAARKDRADLGRLLATPWPGTWQHGLPVLEALVAFGEDPRIALAFARLVEATPYDTWTSHRFYEPLVAYLVRARDARTIPILEKDLDREKSSYWRQGTRLMIARAVEKLRAAPEPLARDDEAALATVEAVFAGVTSAAKSRATDEAELLRAIYEAPDDDGPRAVYADWLVERGDPRGELINLQLAKHGKSGDELAAIEKREATLLNKHGKAWVGSLDHLLAKDGRVFERGFLAAGVVTIEGRPESPPKGFSDPAWATLHTLELDFHARYVEGLALALVELPSMRWVRALRALDEDIAVSLANRAPRPRIEELDFEVARHDDDEDREARAAGRALLAEGRAFPSLRRLVLETDPREPAGVAALEAILGGALAKRLERIAILEYDYDLGALLRVVERLGLSVPEIGAGYPHGRTGVRWDLVLRRDDRGRFTRLHCGSRGGAKLASASDLAGVLEGLPALTELTVERPKTVGWAEEEIQAVEAALGRFGTDLRVDVPWERLAKAPKKKRR